MTLIEVQAPLEIPQNIMVHEGPGDRDNAKEAARYLAEAEAPGLTKWEKWAKLDTAKNLAALALNDKPVPSDLDERVQEYQGNKPARSR